MTGSSHENAVYRQDKYKKSVVPVVVSNFVLFWLLAQADAARSFDWESIFARTIDVLPSALIVALIGAVNSWPSPIAKARIVFLRWRNPLPGSSAFTYYAEQDPRVNISNLERALRELPTQPRKQNEIWYQIYQSLRQERSVQEAQRQYLFYRDWSVMALMMLLLLGPTGFILLPSTNAEWTYLAVLLLQFVLVSAAARTRGRALVTTVLALKSARPIQSLIDTQ